MGFGRYIRTNKTNGINNQQVTRYMQPEKLNE